MKSPHATSAFLPPLVFLGCAPLGLAQALEGDRRNQSSGAPVALSPFLVEEATDQGYYAAQTLAGGRLKQNIQDLGTSIQVVTREFLDDLGVTGVEELFQYTTSTEVGGILGNFLGAGDNFDGETSTGNARRDPDGTTRVRASPPRTARAIFSRPTFPSTATTPSGSTSSVAPTPSCSGWARRRV